MKAIIYTLFILAILIPRESAAVSPHYSISHWPGFNHWLQKPFLADSSGPRIKDYHYYRSRWVSQRNTGWWLTGLGTGGFIIILLAAVKDLEINLNFDPNRPPQPKKDETFEKIAFATVLALTATGIGLLIGSAFSKRKARLALKSESLNPGIPGHFSPAAPGLTLQIPIH